MTPVSAFGLVSDDGVARTDFLDDPFGQENLAFHADELELDGRTAAVEHENFHDPGHLLRSWTTFPS